MRFLALAIAGLALALAAAPLASTAQEDGEDALTERAAGAAEALIAELSRLAADDALSEAERADAMREVMRGRIAAGPMGRFVLGASARAGATPEQLARYEAAFPDYVSTIFASQIDALAAHPIEVREAVALRGDEAVVRSGLIDADGREAATIEWRYRDVEGAPLLLDVLVERISRMVTLRAEFGSVVEREGLDALLAHMEAVLADAAEPLGAELEDGIIEGE